VAVAQLGEQALHDGRVRRGAIDDLEPIGVEVEEPRFAERFVRQQLPSPVADGEGSRGCRRTPSRAAGAVRTAFR
jgi:hypothetical protein